MFDEPFAGFEIGAAGLFKQVGFLPGQLGDLLVNGLNVFADVFHGRVPVVMGDLLFLSGFVDSQVEMSICKLAISIHSTFYIVRKSIAQDFLAFY